MLTMMQCIEQIQHADCEDRIASSLSRFAAGSGYEFWHIARSLPNEWSLKPKKVLSVWPRAWLEQYDSERLGRDDAVVKGCRTLQRPFRWSDLTIDSFRSKRVMQIAASDYGMSAGLCIPYYSVDGFQGAISFGGSEVDLDGSRQLALEVVAIYAFSRFNELKASAPRAPILTPRQREVLHWIAAGKTTWDVAAILHISEQTVRTLVKVAMARLNVHSRAQAIAEAVRLREINL